METLRAKEPVSPEDQALIQQCISRIYQLEFWGDRVISKMGTQVTWKFSTNGPRRASGNLGGKADTSQPWPVTFWCGGWDGDLLTGFLRGQLNIPFRKDE
jgi:hypothetical protein